MIFPKQTKKLRKLSWHDLTKTEDIHSISNQVTKLEFTYLITVCSLYITAWFFQCILNQLPATILQLLADQCNRGKVTHQSFCSCLRTTPTAASVPSAPSPLPSERTEVQPRHLAIYTTCCFSSDQLSIKDSRMFIPSAPGGATNQVWMNVTKQVKMQKV